MVPEAPPAVGAEEPEVFAGKAATPEEVAVQHSADQSHFNKALKEVRIAAYLANGAVCTGGVYPTDGIHCTSDFISQMLYSLGPGGSMRKRMTSLCMGDCVAQKADVQPDITTPLVLFSRIG